ncbi:conjugal transfer protein TraB [Salimicrobium jeotgali]|uniref:Conjugal transfer protein TraB n=2 Tax=Salimicrobium TaxID=351195 RepID=K2H8S6_9BACI|nr:MULTISPECIES: TraB/GumN family protein [Salimicrobium]AKG03559.1 conjugal transfer protein TraB [Salimicrobium jeotgali]EKE32050.1 TraB family protein [Salimicrobium jeotgali]MBM7696017.1 pheromone shutdown-related protein TraB [Salimicrobium jeotgali]SIS87698.1 pheromone shutdown-related protein TraB [Salimicrobium salexigens]
MEEHEDYITRIQIEDKEIVLIGTAHVSRASALQVKEVVEQEEPDSVCVELDEQRYHSVVEGNQWRNMDIFQIIKEKKATLLLMNLAISSFQKRMAEQFGIKAGQEMIQGIESAEASGAELVLADRNIQLTFARIWGNLGFKGKAKLMLSLFAGIFSKESISEEDLEKMKEQDMLDAMLEDFSDNFPRLKQPLIDERDQYLAEKIRTAPGKKVVAVLGAAHVPGITKEVHREHDLEALKERPKKSPWPKIIGWAIPIFIIALIAYTFTMNAEAGMQQTLSWVLWNGIVSAVGAAAAFAHPLAILTAFVAAPVTSLNPLIAAGWFAGFVQAYIKRPNVGDFESLSDDVTSVKGFWNNKATRVLLVIALTNIGSSLGTFIGGADVIRLFLENF